MSLTHVWSVNSGRTLLGNRTTISMKYGSDTMILITEFGKLICGLKEFCQDLYDLGYQVAYYNSYNMFGFIYRGKQLNIFMFDTFIFI